MPDYIYIAQGINPEQYAECALELLTIMRVSDYFGFGGFCIVGRQRKKLLPVFCATIDRVVPLLAQKGIKRAHLFGVCLPEAVTYLNAIGKRYNVVMSNDSSAPELGAFRRGYVYKDGRQTNGYTRGGGLPYIDYHPGELAIANVREYTRWAESL